MKIQSISLAACIVTATCLPGIVDASDNTLVYGNVSGWTIYTDPTQSYHCFAKAEYEGGSTIQVGFNATGAELYLVISDTSWVGASEHPQQTLELSFDDASPQSFIARHVPDESALRLSIPEQDQPSFMKDFAGSYSMNVILGSRDPLMLSLGGSRNATRMLKECRIEMSEVQARSSR